MSDTQTIILFGVAFGTVMVVITSAILAILIYRTNKLLKKNEKVQQEFSEVYWRMDKASVENARGIDERIIERSDELNKRLDYILRWVKHAARTARENRDAMAEHDKRVRELDVIAKKIGLKYLTDDIKKPPG